VSVDQTDFAAVSQRNRQNIGQSMWPILLDATAVGVGIEFEIPINPCDSIWLPTNCDPALFNNSDFAALVQAIVSPATPGNRLEQGGFNSYALIDTGGSFVFLPPVWGLRFNTASNPRQLWGTSAVILINNNSGPAFLAGASDVTRSISGQISRLFATLIFPGVFNNTPSPQDSTINKVLLISSIGYRTSIVGESISTLNIAAGDIGGSDWGIQQQNSSFEAGGYVTPQMNTAERAILENIGQPGAAASGSASPASGVGVPLRRQR
jgi:hypothetical protein